MLHVNFAFVSSPAQRKSYCCHTGSASASGWFGSLKKKLYSLNPWLDLLDTFTGVSYWSKILHTLTSTPLGGLEAKVDDFEILDKNSECP